MNRSIMTVAALLFLGLGAGRVALADPDLELVAGNDIVLFTNGTPSGLTCTSGAAHTVVACSTFGLLTDTFVNGPGASGSATLSFSNFDGWNITIVSGTSNSPNCSGAFGSGCLSDTSINTSGGSDNLAAYFGASGFSPEQNFVVTESGSGVKGTVTAAGYLDSGSFASFSSTAAPTLAGQIGSTLSLSAPATIATSGPGFTTGTKSLVMADVFTAGAGDNYTVTTTITAVPEPASMILFGSGLLAFTGLVKKKLFRS